MVGRTRTSCGAPVAGLAGPAARRSGRSAPWSPRRAGRARSSSQAPTISASGLVDRHNRCGDSVAAPAQQDPQRLPVTAAAPDAPGRVLHQRRGPHRSRRSCSGASAGHLDGRPPRPFAVAVQQRAQPGAVAASASLAQRRPAGDSARRRRELPVPWVVVEVVVWVRSTHRGDDRSGADVAVGIDADDAVEVAARMGMRWCSLAGWPWSASAWEQVTARRNCDGSRLRADRLVSGHFVGPVVPRPPAPHGRQIRCKAQGRWIHESDRRSGRLDHHPRSGSRLRSSVARMPEAWARRNVRQLTDARRGAGRSPLPSSTVRMLVADTWIPSFFSSP